MKNCGYVWVCVCDSVCVCVCVCVCGCVGVCVSVPVRGIARARACCRVDARGTQAMVDEFDRDQDGEINEAEFIYIMKQTSAY